MGVLGNRAQENSSQGVHSRPVAESREGAGCPGECARPRILAGPSGFPHQPCPEPAPPTPEDAGQTQLCSQPPCPAATLLPQTKGLGLYKTTIYVFRGHPFVPSLSCNFRITWCPDAFPTRGC